MDYKDINALILVFHGFADYNGISKKLFYQRDALKALGCKAKLCYLKIDEKSEHLRMADESVIESFGFGIMAKFKKRISYSGLSKYISENKINFLYVRNDHNANPFLLKFLKETKKCGVKIVMEIPTYPYDNEYVQSGFVSKVNLFSDRLFRQFFKHCVDRIVTFTDFKEIFGIPSINISNGIDFNAIPTRKVPSSNNEIRLLGVAEIHFWHGFDRVIEGLKDYYSKSNEQKVYFDVVGKSFTDDVEKLKSLAEKYGISEYVIFHGTKSGKELDEMFDKTDFGIASLGRHRSHIFKIKTLKNREYAARGIPFIYSEIDDDFENMPYIIKAPADESPIDIKSIIDFLKTNNITPNEIRDSIINELSWSNQMKKVVDVTFNNS